LKNNYNLNKELKVNFQPLGKRVLVKRSDEQNTTASGIIIPDNAQEKPSMGEVVAISSEVSELSCGDKVVFGKYGGNEITLNGTKYLILETEDIFGIIK
jgi:chaperonin GroES